MAYEFSTSYSSNIDYYSNIDRYICSSFIQKVTPYLRDPLFFSHSDLNVKKEKVNPPSNYLLF